ncbi:MAG TPA: HepT-like ribonuclease domain-containing protein [Thermoanaerobaculia bacterium]|jgi:uncharacterized protein with HEPN domain
MSPDAGLLQDMLNSARVAVEHVGGATADEFADNVKMQDAALWRLAVIGEAANKVSAATRQALPLPWSEIIGMRHVAIHHYRKLDMRRVWATIHDRLPPLIDQLAAHLARHP